MANTICGPRFNSKRNLLCDSTAYCGSELCNPHDVEMAPLNTRGMRPDNTDRRMVTSTSDLLSMQLVSMLTYHFIYAILKADKTNNSLDHFYIYHNFPQNSIKTSHIF